jgi:MFS family permease
MFESLASPGYRIFLVGLFFAFAAVQMENVARGWLVYELTGSAVALGLVTSLWSIALFIFSPLGGVMADRVDRKRLVMLTYAANGVIFAVVALLVITGRIQVWHLAVASFISGGFFAFNLPGRLALIRELVGEKGVVNAMALNSAVFNIATIVLPPLAGLLADTVGVQNVFVLMAITYGIVASVVALVPRPQAAAGERVTADGVSLVTNIVEGVSFVRRNRAVTGLFVLGFAGVLLGFPYQTLLPAVTADVLHAPASILGLLMATAGLGAFIGNMTVAGQRSTAKLGKPMLFLGVGFGLALILLSFSGTLTFAIGSLLLIGLIGMPFLTINQALVQKVTPGPMQGRVMSLYMLTWGLMPVGIMPLGALADAAGVQTALAVSGVILAAVVIAISAMRFGLTRL